MSTRRSGSVAPEVRIAAVAARQFGLHTRDQALRAELSASKIDRLVRSGKWVTEHAGVYRDIAVPRCTEQEAMAVWLACGPRSAVSHRTAVRLYGLDVPPDTHPEVTRPLGSRVEVPGIKVVLSRHLERSETAFLKGIRVTNPARTIADLAHVLPEDLTEIVLDAMWRRRLVAPERLARYLASPRWRSRDGSRLLRRLVAARLGHSAPESDLETAYLRLLRVHAVPLPDQLQHWVRIGGKRKRIDCAYVKRGVGIELDGFEWHQGHRAAFDDERARENDLRRIGWDFRRFTWAHLVDDPLWVVMTTADAIGLTPSRWKPKPANRPRLTL